MPASGRSVSEGILLPQAVEMKCVLIYQEEWRARQWRGGNRECLNLKFSFGKRAEQTQGPFRRYAVKGGSPLRADSSLARVQPLYEHPRVRAVNKQQYP